MYAQWPAQWPNSIAINLGWGYVAAIWVTKLAALAKWEKDLRNAVKQHYSFGWSVRNKSKE